MIDLSFDNGTVERYTLVLSSRDYNKLGQLSNIRGLRYTNNLNAADELSFEVCKTLDGHEEVLWDEIFDLRLIWVRELNEYFEIRVELTDKVYMTKTITCTSLCECELSQVGLYNIEINTPEDIARPDYDPEYPTVFYRVLPKPEDPDYLQKKNSSLLHRILDKVPAYSIGHVDSSLMRLQRTFSISNSTVYDFLTGDCSEQFNCIFKFDSATRTISAYDLYTVCGDCGHRGDYKDACPKCGSRNLKYFGEDTTIFVSTENLTDSVQFETDVDSIKNAFRLEAGDDNMTAAVINSNPNGSRYIYEFSPEARKDMPKELVEKMDEYDVLFDEYNNNHKIISNPVNSMPIASEQYLEQIVEYVGENTDDYKKGYFYKCVFDDNKNKYAWIISFTDDFNNIVKKYSLNTCQLCGERGEFTVCPKCESQLITQKTWPTIGKITGYKELIPYYYECVDLYSYLKSSMMPQVIIPKTTATEEAKKLNFNIPLSTIGMSRVSKVTAIATANIAVLNYAKTMVRTGFVKITIDTDSMAYPNDFVYVGKTDGMWESGYWSGRFKVTNYEDSTDYVYTDYFENILVNNNYAEFIEQKIIKQLSKADEYAYDVLKLIKKPQPLYEFKDAIRLYSAARLQSFHDAIEAVIGILIDAGQGNSGETTCNTCGYKGDFEDVCPECGSTDLKKSGTPKSELYDAFYSPYYQALVDCEAELNLRNQEIATVWGTYDTAGLIQSEGMVQFIVEEVTNIHKILDFQNYVGEDLYKVYTTYIREDTYSNSNYISDGLDNAQLFDNARQFLDRAKEELHKSAVYQHSIKSNLNNLLAIKEFKPLLDKFELGNWIRVQADDTIYRLRLISYSIDFDNLKNINTEFSDVTITATGLNDIQSIIKQASSMSSSYGYVEKQAESGSETKSVYINNWLENGLNSALIRINNNDNEDIRIDEAGITARTYDDISETYDDEQLRVTHNIIAFTDDGWKSVKAALGKFEMQHHTINEIGINVDAQAVNKYTEYGLVANAVLAGWIVGSYMESSTVIGSHFQFPGNENYIDMSNDTITESKKYFIKYGNSFLLDKNGNAKLKGDVTATSGKIGNWTIESVDVSSIYGLGALRYNDDYVLSPLGTLKEYKMPETSPAVYNSVKIKLGDHFVIDKDGNVYIAGNLTATSGRIGLWNIDTLTNYKVGKGALYYPNGNSSYILAPNGTSVNYNTAGVNGKWTVKFGPNFGISTTGNVFLKGTIYCTEGNIGGVEIHDGFLGSFGSSMNAIGLSPYLFRICGTYGSSWTCLEFGQGHTYPDGSSLKPYGWNKATCCTLFTGGDVDGGFHVTRRSPNEGPGGSFAALKPGQVEIWESNSAVAHFDRSHYDLWNDQSDERLKDNIVEITINDSQHIINELKPKYFNYNNKTSQRTDVVHSGFIAQDVQKIFPKNSGIVRTDVGEYLCLKYEEIIPHLVNIVKDQEKRIKELEEILKGEK